MWLLDFFIDLSTKWSQMKKVWSSRGPNLQSNFNLNASRRQSSSSASYPMADHDIYCSKKAQNWDKAGFSGPSKLYLAHYLHQAIPIMKRWTEPFRFNCLIVKYRMQIAKWCEVMQCVIIYLVQASGSSSYTGEFALSRPLEESSSLVSEGRPCLSENSVRVPWRIWMSSSSKFRESEANFSSQATTLAILYTTNKYYYSYI